MSMCYGLPPHQMIGMFWYTGCNTSKKVIAMLQKRDHRKQYWKFWMARKLMQYYQIWLQMPQYRKLKKFEYNRY
ncbi:hypothetical protein JTB14_010844 [Gonioctena quinquepunctata]|nr:hypothetical protein JTB14_010844 [Gonioctena quinquepunctata]